VRAVAETIDSVKHPLIQSARSLTTGTGRRRAGEALADGLRLVVQLLESGSDVRAVLVPAGAADPVLAGRAADAGVDVHPVRPGVLRHVLGAAVPPDALAIVGFPAELGATVPAGGLTVVCDGVADPGNLGSIIRTARGLGAAGVVLTDDTDPAARRVIEASRGAVLRVAVHRFAGPVAAVGALQAAGWLVVGTAGDAPVAIDDVEVPSGRVALVVGNETDGLSARTRRAVDVEAAIRLTGGVESLNVGAAAAIGLHVLGRRTRGGGWMTG
jgi:TrmH family RNA methyltransferase